MCVWRVKGGGWGEGSGVDGRISKEPGAWNSIEIMRRKSVGKQELGKRRKLPNCFDILVLEGALRSGKNRIFE